MTKEKVLEEWRYEIDHSNPRFIEAIRKDERNSHAKANRRGGVR